MGSYTLAGSITNIAANATSAEQIPANRAVMPYNAIIELGAFANVATPDINTTFLALGNPLGESIMIDNPIPFGATLRSPIYPDDFIANAVVAKGSSLSLTFRNTTATATTDIQWTIRVTEAR